MTPESLSPNGISASTGSFQPAPLLQRWSKFGRQMRLSHPSSGPSVKELDVTKAIFDRVQKEVQEQMGVELPCLYGTMIEIPRACLLADKMAKTAQFFSFGTNDLTQMSFGFSRDDIGSFLHDYLEDNILEADPFQTIDQNGVGQLIQMAVQKGRCDAQRSEDRHLRRAGRRSGQRGVLLPQRVELRQLQPVPRADRPVGGRPSGDQGEEVSRREAKTGNFLSRRAGLSCGGRRTRFVLGGQEAVVRSKAVQVRWASPPLHCTPGSRVYGILRDRSHSMLKDSC